MEFKKLIEIDKEKYHFGTITKGLANGYPKVFVYKRISITEALKTGQTNTVTVNVNVLDFKFPIDLELLRGQAIGQSSNIEYFLRDLLIQYFKKYSTEIESIFSEEEKEEIAKCTMEIYVSKLDFMHKKKLLSKLLKKSNILEYTKGNTKLLTDYITERNKYGHGLLCMLTPDKKILLRHGNIYGDEFYCPIDKDNLKTFMDAGEFLLSWFFEIHTAIQQN